MAPPCRTPHTNLRDEDKHRAAVAKQHAVAAQAVDRLQFCRNVIRAHSRTVAAREAAVAAETKASLGSGAGWCRLMSPEAEPSIGKTFGLAKGCDSLPKEKGTREGPKEG